MSDSRQNIIICCKDDNDNTKNLFFRYRANYTASSVSNFGHAAGCGFVEEKCIIDESLAPSAKGFFCAKSNFQTCDPTHTRKSDCDLFNFDEGEESSTESPPKEFQYFGNSDIRPKYFTRADYCPVAHLNGKILFRFNFKAVSIFKSTFLTPSPAIWCANPNLFSMSSSFQNIGEKFSPDSKCFNTDDNRALCIEALCNYDSKVLEISIGDELLICDKDFDLKKIPGSKVNIECPRIAQVCPDMFCPANW